MDKQAHIFISVHVQTHLFVFLGDETISLLPSDGQQQKPLRSSKNVISKALNYQLPEDCKKQLETKVTLSWQEDKPQKYLTEKACE